jgi:hypothetical protein
MYSEKIKMISIMKGREYFATTSYSREQFLTAVFYYTMSMHATIGETIGFISNSQLQKLVRIHTRFNGNI